MGFIGIKDLHFAPLQKRDLLLFDQIAIPDLSTHLARISDKSVVADYEWLAEKGILFEINEKDVLQKMLKSKTLYSLSPCFESNDYGHCSCLRC